MCNTNLPKLLLLVNNKFRTSHTVKQRTWKRRSSTFSATSYTHTYLLRPPANSMLPSALKVREVNAAPDDKLPAERLQVVVQAGTDEKYIISSMHG